MVYALPDVFNGVSEDESQLCLAAFKWHWLTLEVPWTSSDHRKYPMFPVPIARLTNFSVDGFGHLII